MATKAKRTKGKPPTEGFGQVRGEDLAVFGAREMDVYATEVNLSRAVPDLLDGLKPVQRRILWASSRLGRDMVKTARVVGEVIGRYHPHGDQSVSDAITVMVQSNQPPIRGKGNWGSLIDVAAAMRYTNCTLSDYGWTFFDRDYIVDKVTAFVPNYDDTTVEPVSLPALFPNVLMTGSEGIGVRTTTCLPAFTAESLARVMLRLLKGEALQPLDFAKALKYSNRYGGQVVDDKANRAAWLQMFKEPATRVLFEARLDEDRDNKAIEIDDWPKGLSPTKLIAKLRLLPEVDQAYNSKGATRIRVEMKRDHNYSQFDKLLEKVQKMTRVARSFKINVTHRKSAINDGVVTFDTKYLSMSVPHLLMTWMRERLALEKRSLTYRIDRQHEAIAYSELLIFVAKNADAIIKVIRASKDPEPDLMKRFKLTEVQAKQVLALQLRRLSKLDQDAIHAELDQQRKLMKQLQLWLKEPKTKVALDTEAVLKAIASDAKFEASKDRKVQIN